MVAMFIFSHASVSAQLEAFLSVNGGLGNSREAEFGSVEDIVAELFKEYGSQVWKI
jgi:hypothetical protein